MLEYACLGYDALWNVDAGVNETFVMTNHDKFYK